MYFSKNWVIFLGVLALPLAVIGAESHSPMGHGPMDGMMGHDPMRGMNGMSHGSEGAGHEPHWMAPDEYQTSKNPVVADLPSVARGEATFKQNCVVCHGAAGTGDGPGGAALTPKPADLSMMVGMHPDGDIAWKIRNGRGPMPAWGSILQENQVWDIVNFLRLKIAMKGMNGHPMHHHHMMEPGMDHQMEKHGDEHGHEE